jgi:hypothetical protein
MKRLKLELKLKRQLNLVRSTVRKLTPEELEQVRGGEATLTCPPTCSTPYTE